MVSTARGVPFILILGLCEVETVAPLLRIPAPAAYRSS